MVKINSRFSFCEPKPILDEKLFSKSICPCVVLTDENDFLLIFAGEKNEESIQRNTNLYYLRSKESGEWALVNDEPTLKFPRPVNRLLAPNIKFINEKIHLFFEVRDGEWESIFHATSYNFQEWIIDETPILSNESCGYGTPFLFESLDGDLEFFFHKRTKNSFDIWKSKVTNFDSKINLGTHFRVVAQNQTYSRYAAYSPWVMYIGDTEYIFYSGWPNGESGGRIYNRVYGDDAQSMESEYAVDVPINQYNSKHSSEPSLLLKQDQLHLFFEGCGEDGNWRILHSTQR